ncbi:MAG: tRNA (adenosine(37)-N6)-threonylcarbamoyltransferase complex dimerization subunit type 1 TsaB [Anaerolinea sp.]|nr:tRNA (adenosine(37)-N6)-threonylcarbamoyltransferase complex dimerization subunit type 1 TsaB [Anaerolinea sp.]
MLLAIDSSTQMVGLALYDGAQVIGETVWRSQNHHTVELAPAIRDLFSRCGVTAADLRALAVALGPGSFTSLRIGLAVAKGMALALHLPVVGLPTLDVLVAAQPLCDLPLAAVLQAGRSRLAVGWYRSTAGGWQADGQATVLTLEKLFNGLTGPALICGELGALERQTLARHKGVVLASPAQSVRRPALLAELAWQRWRAGQVNDGVTLAPIYLSTADAIPE